MAQQTLNNGESGGTIRGKINANNTELYGLKQDKFNTYNLKTNNYTIELADAGLMIPVDKVTGVTITVPEHASVAFPLGTVIGLKRINTGVITVAGAGAAVVTGTAGVLTDPGLDVVFYLEKTGTNVWKLHNGTAIGVWTSLVTTPTGYAVGHPTSNEVTYTIIGKMCFVRGLWSGTGSSTATTITIPNLPAISKYYCALTVRVVNNATAAVGLAEIAAGTTTLTVYATITGGTFTANVTRSVFLNIYYEIQ